MKTPHSKKTLAVKPKRIQTPTKCISVRQNKNKVYKRLYNHDDTSDTNEKTRNRNTKTENNRNQRHTKDTQTTKEKGDQTMTEETQGKTKKPMNNQQETKEEITKSNDRFSFSGQP